MNIKYIFKGLVLSLSVLAVTACSDDYADSVISPEPPTVDQEAAPDSYQLTLNIAKPCFDGDISRADGDWVDGDIIYLFFDNPLGGAWALATRVDGNWALTMLYGKMPKEGEKLPVCAYYFENVISRTDLDVDMDFASIPYVGESTYNIKDSAISMTVSLNPIVSRIRFAGQRGQTVSMSAKSHDLVTPDLFHVGVLQVGFEITDISLKVNSTGYTDYIYAIPMVDDGDNRLAITLDDGTKYTRKIDASELAKGRSGVLRLPTADNLYGWHKVEQEPEHVYDWHSLGRTRFDEPFFCGGIYDFLSPVSYYVEVEEDANAPGLYRLIAPYGDGANAFLPGLTDKGNDHHIMIDATDPDHVYILRQYTGMEIGGIYYYVSDVVGGLMYLGYEMEVIKREGIKFGKKVGNTITFDTDMLVLWLDESSLKANMNGPFVLTIPDGSSSGNQDVQFDREDFSEDIDLGKVMQSRSLSLPASLPPRTKTIKFGSL